MSRDMTFDQAKDFEKRGVLGWLIRHPVAAGVLLLLLTLIVSVFLVDKGMKNKLQARIAEIRARGEPVSIDDLNSSPNRLNDSENHFQAMMSHVSAIQQLKRPENYSLLPLLGTGKDQPTGIAWTNEEQEAVDWYLASIRDNLEALHKELSAGAIRYQPRWTSPALNISMPELSQVRACSKVLSLEAQHAAQRHDQLGAGRLLNEFQPLMHWIGDDATLITALVHIACSAVFQDAVERTINISGLSEESLKVVSALLRELESVPDLRRAIMVEQMMMIDTYESIRSGAIPFASVGIPSVPNLQIPIFVELNFCAILDVYGELARAIGSRDIASLEKARALSARVEKLPKQYYLAQMLLPSLTRGVELWIRELALSRALQTALAVERFRLAERKWPASLDAIVPAYMDKLYFDPFDGKSIRFAIIPEGIKVWSIGEDLKDNGGDVKRLEPVTGNLKDAPADWGWVILNPELRGRPAPAATTQNAKP